MSGDIVRQIVGKYVIHYLQLMQKDEWNSNVDKNIE